MTEAPTTTTLPWQQLGPQFFSAQCGHRVFVVVLRQATGDWVWWVTRGHHIHDNDLFYPTKEDAMNAATKYYLATQEARA